MKTMTYMKKILLLLFIHLVSFSIYAQEDLLKEAENAYVKEDYTKAIELYESILNKNGESAAVYYNLGNANIRKQGCADEPECTGRICEDRRDGQFFGSSRGTVSFAVSAFAADPHAGGAAAV